MSVVEATNLELSRGLGRISALKIRIRHITSRDTYSFHGGQVYLQSIIELFLFGI
jgi:hypothetical protein